MIERGYPPAFSCLGYRFVYKVDNQWYSTEENMLSKKSSAQKIDVPHRLITTKIGNSCFYGLSEDRKTVFDLQAQEEIHRFEKQVRSIDLGGGHLSFLLEDGTIFTKGNPGWQPYTKISGEWRELKIPHPDELKEYGGDANGKVVAISSGFYYTFLLLANGQMVHIGQNNGEKYLGSAIQDIGLIDCAVRVKCLASGSNHSVAVSVDGRLYGLCGMAVRSPMVVNPSESLEIFVPSEFEVKKWYNVACGGGFFVASADNGIYGFKNQSTQYTKNSGNVSKISDLQPHQIKQIFCTYDDAYVIPFPGHGDAFFFNGSKMEKTPFSEFPENASFPISAGCRAMEWSKENHSQWPDSFKKHTVIFLLAIHVNNSRTKVSIHRVPKVLQLLIITFYSQVFR